MYEKQSRNTNRSTDTVASFLLKTYQILQHPEYENIISWDKTNMGFIIHDIVLFTREILPKYFRHSNFSSFVRQLNMYDFHKVKQDNEILVFKNPLFCKGQQQNLKFIRRKAAKKITGQKRAHLSQKSEVENEKYQNLLKGFKKSFETQINQSSLFYQRSLQIIKDLNDSNLKKRDYLKDMFINEQKLQTTEQMRKISMIDTKLVSQPKEMEMKKDTSINISKEHLPGNENQITKVLLQGEKQNIHQRKISPNLDNLMLLKQQVYKSLGNYHLWLQDYIETQKKKLKYIQGYRQQLIKCRQTKVNDGDGNEDHEAREDVQMSNSKQSSQGMGQSQEEKGSILLGGVKEQTNLNPLKKGELKIKSFSSFPQPPQPYLRTRLFSAFSQSKVFQQVGKQNQSQQRSVSSKD